MIQERLKINLLLDQVPEIGVFHGINNMGEFHNIGETKFKKSTILRNG